jgi:hypothetical protein
LQVDSDQLVSGGRSKNQGQVAMSDTESVVNDGVQPHQGAANNRQSSTSLNPGNTSSMYHNRKTLKFSTSNLTLPSDGSYAYVEVWAADGTPIPFPKVADIPGLLVYVSDFISTSDDESYPMVRDKWAIGLKQLDMNSAGLGTLHTSAYISMSGVLYEGSLKVAWKAAPSFYVERVGMDRVEGPTTITFIMKFRLVPNHPHFGNPTVHARVQIPGGGDYCDGGIRERIFQYNGQDEQSLTCIINKPEPYVPGNPLPPLRSGFLLRPYVHGTINGQLINGGTGLSEIDYAIEPY